MHADPDAVLFDFKGRETDGPEMDRPAVRLDVDFRPARRCDRRKVAMEGPRQGIREGGAKPSQSYLTMLLGIGSLLGFDGTECGLCNRRWTYS